VVLGRRVLGSRELRGWCWAEGSVVIIGVLGLDGLWFGRDVVELGANGGFKGGIDGGAVGRADGGGGFDWGEGFGELSGGEGEDIC